ncbi:MAG: right-handed parallel beta-helix repeat-containing protein [Sedimentisphaerales bacterium]|nr:right-handed parallel beta-helix repeat-containing protein [Sedimentisphaerales bacterium]
MTGRVNNRRVGFLPHQNLRLTVAGTAAKYLAPGTVLSLSKGFTWGYWLTRLIIAFILLSLPSIAAATEGPIAHWKFDETTGTIAYDSTGSHNGTLINGPVWTTGQINGALSFDGSDDWVNMGTDIFSQATFAASGATISVWVCPTSTPANKDYVVGIEGRFIITESASSTNYWEAAIYDGDTQAVKSISAIEINKWVHLVATWDKTTLRFYVNGLSQGSVAQGTPLIDAVSRPVTVGAFYDAGALYYPIPAIVDDVRIYDRALSASEIWQLYREGLGPKASNPNPANGATGVDLNVVLSWSPGKDAASHDVYLGTDYNDVNDADINSPEYKGNFDVNTFDPCGLELSTIYYWRVDEVNGPDLWKGNVWSFETERPAIGLSVTQLEFVAIEGGANPEDQILGISNNGAGTLNWQISKDCSWLSVSPVSGSSMGELDDVTLSVDISDLVAGIYNCSLTISDSNAGNSPQMVVVQLRISGYILHVPSDCGTIQEAIDIVLDGGTVIVAPGTYTGSGNRDIDFKGKAITVQSSNPDDPNVVAATIIDCNATSDHYSNYHQGFYFHSGEDPNSVLSGLTITNGYNTYGGGIRCSSSSPTINNCIITGNGSSGWGGGMYNDNSNPIIINCAFIGNKSNSYGGGGMYNKNSNPTITNCTITYNIAKGYNGYGGGICNENSSLTVTNCTFSGNSASRGSGMDNYYSSLILTNCAFSDNSASGNGGGMYSVGSSSTTLTYCTFCENSASSGGGLYSRYGSNLIITSCIFNGNLASSRGSGMYNDNTGSPTLNNCTFIDNSASNNGGGMYNSLSRPALINCTLIGNSAYSGGGMANDSSSSPTLTNCTFGSNSALLGGGGMFNSSGGPALINCTFNGNTAGYFGGGMHNYSSRPTITNCTFTGNSTSSYGGSYGSHGGGMYNESSSPTLTNCIFSNNLTYEDGGGIYNFRSSPKVINCTFNKNSTYEKGGGMYNNSSSPTITNCIIWGNTAPSGAQIYDSSSTNTVSFSDVKGGWTGTGNINADPLFFNAAGGDLHLLPASPCINAGDPNFIPEPNETDIDGEPRVMLGRVDMGADEFNPFEIDFVVVNKRRVGRTLFEYDCVVYVTNILSSPVINFELEIIKAPENLLLIDPNVTFGSLEIAPGQSATSSDTCTFQIDRSQSTDPAKIIWQSTCEIVDGGTPGSQLIAAGTYLLNLGIIPGDFNLDNKVDSYDLNILADQWLLPPGSPSADIAPLPTGDDFVDFLDFAVLANHWLEGSSP